ncbi:ATP-binding cassette domain-containing protein [Terrabacter terrae]
MGTVQQANASGTAKDRAAGTPGERRPDGPPVLTAVGLSKAYRRPGLRRGRLPVLDGADLTLATGEVVGVVGENGSGKSTLMRILVGDLGADAGSVTATGRVGYCPQQPVFYPRLTCDEHFELFAHAYALTDAELRAGRDDLYASLGFERYRDSRANSVSGGTLAKLNLGLALLPNPPLLLLDEPYAGFDWDTYLKFWDLVEGRRREGGSALIISHFVVDEQRFDRIVEVRDDGRGHDDERDPPVTPLPGGLRPQRTQPAAAGRRPGGVRHRRRTGAGRCLQTAWRCRRWRGAEDRDRGLGGRLPHRRGHVLPGVGGPRRGPSPRAVRPVPQTAHGITDVHRRDVGRPRHRGRPRRARRPRTARAAPPGHSQALRWPPWCTSPSERSSVPSSPIPSTAPSSSCSRGSSTSSSGRR